MTKDPDATVRKMPKGGRKGGSVFPRISLRDAIGYAHKLVSKTHTSAQPRDLIFSGVVGAKSGIGNIRISALKQYGFLMGDNKSLYSADDLAKKIAAAPPDELVVLYRQAMFKPSIFKKLFETFQGDTVSKAKLRQRASDLRVHPEETSACIDIYISGMEEAGLITLEGDQVNHLALSNLDTKMAAAVEVDDENLIDEGNDISGGDPVIASRFGDVGDGSGTQGQGSIDIGQGVPRAVFNVNVSLDSSLDTEKLQKQLELLKRFGAI